MSYPYASTAGAPVRLGTATMSPHQPLGYETYQTYETVPSTGTVKSVPYLKLSGETWLEKVAPYSCEFFGTFFLVFVVTTVTCFSRQGWGAIGIAFALMCLVYSMGSVSGGHFNPAVSLACGLAQKMPAWQVLGYWFSQYWGGLFAGLFCQYVFFDQNLAYGPKPGYTWFESSICEIAYTSMLCFVVLNCAYSEKNNPSTDKNQFYAIAIGFVIIAGGYACSDVSGGIFNPCVALGVQMVRTGDQMEGLMNVGRYAAAEFFGACIGALLFYIVRIEEYKPRSQQAEPYFLQYMRTNLGPRLIAELFGTFMVVLTFCLNILLATSMTAWATGAAVISMTYSLTNVSGAHFNPAVTMAVVLTGRRKLPLENGVFYLMIQVAAGILAGLVACLTNAQPTARMPPGGFAWSQIMAAELIFTFILIYVMLTCATVESTIEDSGMTRQNFYYALAIGAIYIAGGIAVLKVSSAVLNPAIALGLTTYSNTMPKNPELLTTPSVAHFFYYISFELCGALLAALIFHLSHAKEYRKRSDLVI